LRSEFPPSAHWCPPHQAVTTWSSSLWPTLPSLWLRSRSSLAECLHAVFIECFARTRCPRLRPLPSASCSGVSEKFCARVASDPANSWTGSPRPTWCQVAKGPRSGIWGVWPTFVRPIGMVLAERAGFLTAGQDLRSTLVPRRLLGSDCRGLGAVPPPIECSLSTRPDQRTRIPVRVRMLDTLFPRCENGDFDAAAR